MEEDTKVSHAITSICAMTYTEPTIGLVHSPDEGKSYAVDN